MTDLTQVSGVLLFHGRAKLAEFRLSCGLLLLVFNLRDGTTNLRKRAHRVCVPIHRG